VLINLESVGEMDDYGSGGMSGLRFRESGFDFDGLSRGGPEYARDVKWLGHADDGVRKLVELCGWKVRPQRHCRPIAAADCSVSQDELDTLHKNTRTRLSEEWGLSDPEATAGEDKAEAKAEAAAEHVVETARDQVEDLAERLGNVAVGTETPKELEHPSPSGSEDTSKGKKASL
jgi:hypothetical protein